MSSSQQVAVVEPNQVAAALAAKLEMLPKQSLLDSRHAQLSFLDQASRYLVVDDAGPEYAVGSFISVDEELVVSLPSKSIEGFPAHHLGRAPGTTANISKGEAGAMVFAFVRHKETGRLRLHLALRDAEVEFSADKSRERTSASLAIPLLMGGGGCDKAAFHNCIVTRQSKTNSAVSVTATSKSASRDAAGATEARGGALCCSLSRLFATARAAIVEGVFPCVDELRPSYPCCSERCRGDFYACLCCTPPAATARAVEFKAEEVHPLGPGLTSPHGADSDPAGAARRKVVLSRPGQPTVYENCDAEWHACPWCSCLCLLCEFRGDCDCKLLQRDAVDSKLQWKLEQTVGDELVLELEFSPECEAAASSTQLTRLGVKVDVNAGNIDQLHAAARSLVSLVHVHLMGDGDGDGGDR